MASSLPLPWGSCRVEVGPVGLVRDGCWVVDLPVVVVGDGSYPALARRGGGVRNDKGRKTVSIDNQWQRHANYNLYSNIYAKHIVYSPWPSWASPMGIASAASTAVALGGCSSMASCWA